MSETLTVEELSRVRRLAAEVAGIAVDERHRDLLDRRSRRLGGRTRLLAVMDAVEGGDPSSRQAFLRYLIVNHTSFFRNPHHFDVAADHVQRAVALRGRARVWCAGASTGEEAYSAAMAAIERLEGAATSPEGSALPIEVLATDVDEDALAGARRGEYGQAALAAISPERRRRFFAPTSPGASTQRVDEAVRAVVRCEPLNLVDASWSGLGPGPFDAIFCRNVLMYLTPDHRYSVLESMTGAIAADGLLFIDPAEHLGPASHMFEAMDRGVYRPRPARPLPPRLRR